MKHRRIATNRATAPTAENIHAYARREAKIHGALVALKQARDLLREAGASHAHTATTRAIKSTQGAYNHARGLWEHLSRQAAPEPSDLGYWSRRAGEGQQ